MLNLKQLAQYSLTQSRELQSQVLNAMRDFSEEDFDSDIFYLMGLLSANIGEFESSFYYYSRCLDKNPTYKNALFDLGAIHFNLGYWNEGIMYGEQVYRLDKDFKNITQHLANSYSQIGKHDEANHYYRESIELNPNNIQVWADYFLSLNYCNIPIESRIELQNEYKRQGFQNNEFPKIVRKSKIRIGYVSSDFRNHAVSYFYKGLITHHNQEVFDVYFYSTSDINDDITQKFQESGTFKCITNSELLYNTIILDDIDILIDLNGYTRGHSLDVFINNPSPIQITWLGFLNSLSLSSLPYKLTDRNLIDDSIKDYYTEELLLLNNCLFYDPPQNCPNISPLPYLKNGYLTFGFFNNFRKVNDDVLYAWSKILLSHKDCKFIMISSDFKHQNEYVIDYLNNQGFTNIEMVKQGDIIQFMELFNQVDVSLDPFHHVGGVTTAHSLWMGVPVLTLQGSLESERISSALLKNVGLDYHVSFNQEEYIQKGIDLDSNTLIEIRRHLRDRFPKRDSILKELENTYIGLYHKHSTTDI